MNSTAINRTFQFIVLVLVQALILNHINFSGYINPYLYIIFIILFPVINNRTFFIFIAFLLGLCVDILSDSGGINAAACVTIAYIRPVILKFSFGSISDYQTIKFEQTEFGSRLTYFSILTVIHHLIMFSLEVFNISKIVLIFQKTFFSTIFTVLLCLLIMILFSKKQK